MPPDQFQRGKVEIMTGPEADPTDLPRYRSHKEVRALQIERVGRKIIDGGTPPEHVVRSVEFTNRAYGPINLPHVMFLRYMPVPGDYYVVYDDGYDSFSPKKAFEEGYTLIE
jgi:hypothetical protein